MKTSHENYLEELYDSPMLYLSAGSKELFHSNFLYWLSNSNWDAFIHVLRNLAGLGNDEHFWWEESYSLKNENLTVRREYHHFDLSVCIHIHKNKWVPVLVLENKMKSLPYPEQLIDYSAKAKKEWGKTENNGKGKITFILLSLTDATSLRKEPNLKTWSFKKYIDLAKTLKNWPNKYTGFHRQLYENYCQFICALSIWERIIDSVQTPSEITRKKIERWATQAPMSGKNSWCRYGDSFIYRYRHIKPSETISDIIDNIVNDAQEILNLFRK